MTSPNAGVRIETAKQPELKFNAKTHRYTWNGAPLVNVTSVIGILDKPALKQWAADMACDHIRKVWRPDAKSDFEIESHLKAARMAFRDQSKAAADAGTEAHDWIERDLYGVDQTLPAQTPAIVARGPEFVAAVGSSVQAWLEWKHSNDVQPVEAEWLVADPILGFGGKLDLIAWVNGWLTLVDLKTGKGVYPEFYLQTGAYLSLALPLMTWVDGPNRRPVTAADVKRVILHIPKDGGSAEAIPVPTPLCDDMDTFRSLIVAFKWNKKYGRDS